MACSGSIINNAALKFTSRFECGYLVEGKSSVSTEVLRMIHKVVRHLEVSDCSSGEWERAIIQGFKVWREVKKRRGGKNAVSAAVAQTATPATVVTPSAAPRLSRCWRILASTFWVRVGLLGWGQSSPPLLWEHARSSCFCLLVAVASQS